MPSVKSDTVRANGLEVHYATEGSGPPLLMLHGATSMGTLDWGAQRPLLRAEFTLVMPDARGHHRTRFDAAHGWSRAALVDDALAIATAVELAARHPERVLSLVAVSPTMEPRPAASVARRRLDPEAILRDEPGWAAELEQRHDPHQGAGAWRRLVVAIRDDTQELTAMTPEQLRRIRLPVLLAYGDRDPWVPLEQAVRIRRQLPDARLLVVPACGHVVQAERPSLFNPALMQFLRAVKAGA